jgi:hypothetical protein
MKRASRPRKIANLSESVQQHLNMYALAASAAGVGALALTQPAEAKIVYTPAHVTLQAGKPFPLDLNHDGKSDFFLMTRTVFDTASRWQYLAVCHRPFMFSAYYSCASSSSAPNAQNAVRTKGSRWAAALRTGSKIEKGDRFKDKVVVRMGTVRWQTWTTSTLWSGPWVNGGQGVKNRYLGLKFKVDGRFHFAWARLSVKPILPHGFTATLTGYAYETIPDKAIAAGQTHELENQGNENASGAGALLDDHSQDADHAGSLGRLALGAAGRIVGKAKE